MALLDHGRHDTATKHHRRAHIDLLHVPPLFGVGFEDGRVRTCDRGIVDEYLDVAQAGFNSRTEGGHMARLGNVAGDGNLSGARTADQVCRYGQFISRAGGKTEVPSEPRQPDGQLSADPTPGPGDQSDLPSGRVVDLGSARHRPAGTCAVT